MNDLAISIIIVNWNGSHLLTRCLTALRVAMLPNDQVIVVDNGSTDDSVHLLQTTFPWVTLIALPTNLGFAGGNNAGLTICLHTWLLLINNDAFVAPDALTHLRQMAITCPPTTGAIAATLLFDHAPDLVASSGIVLRRDGVAIDRDMTRPVADIPSHPQAIAGASGGAVLLRRAMIDDIGFFATDFFNYLEDVDLAWRALLRGWHTIHLPIAHIRHVYSATSGQGSPFKQRLLGRNRWRTLIRCLPNELWWRYFPAIISYDIVACIALAIRGQWAGISGRWSVLAEFATLMDQRRTIQSRRTVSIAHITAWLAPAPWPWQEYREIQRLATIMAQRATTTDKE
ncbi:MAG: glycosyltransferase family 2 protein [Chloroflexia bacterium]|nr:glycosyltransferase family 2 protein [Chloroflexia bacterium]